MKKSTLQKPIITEKSLKDAKRGIFTFAVAKYASKDQIIADIEHFYHVHAVGIKTLIKKGKVKAAGKKRTKIRKPDTKKAYIYLAKGEKIDLFEAGETA